MNPQRPIFTGSQKTERDALQNGFLYFIIAILMISGIYTVMRGFDTPINYPICQWFTTYQNGFIKRGLVGTLISPLFIFKTGAEIRQMVQLWAMTLLVLKLICVGFICKEMITFAQRKLQTGGALIIASVWIFVMSPHIVFTSHASGYFDHILEICTIAAVLAVFRQRYVLVPIICVMALCVHEMFVIYGLPVILFALTLKLFQKNISHFPRFHPVLTMSLILLPILTVGIIMCCAQEYLSEHTISTISTRARQYDAMSPGCINNMAGHLGENVVDSWKLQKEGIVIKRLTKEKIVTPMYPVIGFILLMGTMLLGKSKKWLSIPIFVAASLSPLLTNFIAWDDARFASNTIFQAFICMFTVVLFLPQRLNVNLPTQIIFLLIGAAVWANNLLQPVPLMGGRTDGAGLFSTRNMPTEKAFNNCTPLFTNSTFDKGDLRNWHSHGDAFRVSHKVLRESKFNSSAEGPYWLLSFSRKERSKGGVIGDKTTGKLVSKEFIIKRNTILFKIGGGKRLRQTYVALFIGDEEIYRDAGTNGNGLTMRYWDVSKYQEQKARIEIVDQSRDYWGHIDADQFCWSN